MLSEKECTSVTEAGQKNSHACREMLAEEILKFGNAFREKDEDERTVAAPLTQRTVPCVPSLSFEVSSVLSSFPSSGSLRV